MDWCIPIDAYFLDPQGRPGPPPPNCFASEELGRRLNFDGSHQLSRFPGGVVCWKCGCWSASARAVGLRKPCANRATPSGRLALDRVSQGRPARWMPVDEAEATKNARERAQTVQRAEELQRLETLRRSLVLESEGTGTAKRYRYYSKQPPRSTVASASDQPATTPDEALSFGALTSTASDLPDVHFLDPVLNIYDLELLTMGELIEAQLVGFEEVDNEDPFAWGMAMG